MDVYNRKSPRQNGPRLPEALIKDLSALVATGAERRLAFHSIGEGETVRGRLLGSVQLASGRFAMIDDGLGFSLVPWRPVSATRMLLSKEGSAL